MNEFSHLEQPVAVVLAAGRGSRLQASRSTDTQPTLTDAQERAAATGIKALVPVIQSAADGSRRVRPFVWFLLSSLARAGVRRVCFVVRPDLENPGELFPNHPALAIEFARQARPRGTADAVACSEVVVGSRDLLVLNSDTYYPAAMVEQLVSLGVPGLIAIDGYAVAENPNSNLTAEQMAAWATVTIDRDGFLEAVGKPPQRPPTPPWWVNVNAWRFDASIFRACAALEQIDGAGASSGELELPVAVEWSRAELGLRYRVGKSTEPLLDLTTRTDIGDLQRLLPSG